jgi:hypothetical protein
MVSPPLSRTGQISVMPREDTIFRAVIIWRDR